MSSKSESNQVLVQLTQEAVEAAKEGKWDQVINLYDRRALDGRLEQASPEVAEKLIEWDQWIMARIQEAQAAVKQNIADVQDRRRKLAILRAQWGSKSSVQGRYFTTV